MTAAKKEDPKVEEPTAADDAQDEPTAAVVPDGYPEAKHLDGCPQSRAVETRVRTFTSTKGPRYEVHLTRCPDCGETARGKRVEVED